MKCKMVPYEYLYVVFAFLRRSPRALLSNVSEIVFVILDACSVGEERHCVRRLEKLAVAQIDFVKVDSIESAE